MYGVTLLLLLTVPYSIQGLDLDDHQDCLKYSGMQPAEWEALTPEKVPSKEGLCFMLCLGKKFEFIHSDGTFDKDAVLKQHVKPDTSPEEIKKMLECLNNAQPLIECEDIQKMRACFV